MSAKFFAILGSPCVSRDLVSGLVNRRTSFGTCVPVMLLQPSSSAAVIFYQGGGGSGKQLIIPVHVCYFSFTVLEVANFMFS